ncbi:MAG: hypothetical protein Q9181_008147, partial [Wetmoreana brouardii]
LDACTPTLTPKQYETLNGWVTICNNGCSVYVCGIKGVKFFKRSGTLSAGVYRRRDPRPTPDPPPPQPQPTNDISSTSLTPDQVHQDFYQIPYGSLVELVASFGEDTSGKSQADLVAVAWNRFEASMGNLDIGQVDAAASLANFEQGQGSWAYYGDKIGPST